MGKTLVVNVPVSVLSTDYLHVNYTSGLKLPFQGESNSKLKGKKWSLESTSVQSKVPARGLPCLPQQVPSPKSCFALLAVLGTLRHAGISSFAFSISKGASGELHVAETKGNQ